MTRKILTIALLVSIIAFLISILAFPRVSRADVDLWPLLETSEDSTTVLYPSYVHESEFLMVFPFFYRTNEGQDYHYLWPLIKVAEGRLTRAAPFWFNSEEDEYTPFAQCKHLFFPCPSHPLLTMCRKLHQGLSNPFFFPVARLYF